MTKLLFHDNINKFHYRKSLLTKMVLWVTLKTLYVKVLAIKQAQLLLFKQIPIDK